MKILGAGYPCERHSDSEAMVRCRFPESGPARCHHCNKDVPVNPEAPKGATVLCGPECSAAWDTEHPGYWSPIEDTLPGGRYDGVWENSGFKLTFGGRDEN